MEHIVQFGVTIDDESIRANIERNAMDAVVKTFVNEMKSNLPKSFYGKSVDWSRVAYDAIETFINEHKDEILDMMAEKLVERVTKTKAYREARDKALGGQNV